MQLPRSVRALDDTPKRNLSSCGGVVGEVRRGIPSRGSPMTSRAPHTSCSASRGLLGQLRRELRRAAALFTVEALPCTEEMKARGVRGRGCAASQTESTDGGSRHGATQPPARDPPAHASLTPRSLQLHLSLRASPPRLASPLSRGSTSGSGIMGIKVVVMVLALTLLLSVVMAQPLLNEGQEGDSGQADVDYTADLLERLLSRTQKQDDLAEPAPVKRWRSCIRRMGACDHRPNDCCYNSSCRCNLWGTNCRCQRMGLFQQWGK
ncbi:uncharacterized protein LOC122254159 [Penaeus japonicus]|uniref:uncharacterized protein LOC122254159 n=1 Tax=Penaeus japonicus TaxID=27405 RepID=UPI001C711F02|nr:uncharacterized protein LOC122254159 [Penaeus japonicus]